MTDEPVYSFGSADNTHSFDHEFLLEAEYRPSSKHSVRCSLDAKPCGSAILGASGGGTGIHARSCVVLANRCLVAVGDRVATLALPDLGLLWQAKADDATCFGLHVTRDEQHLVVHGELEISKFTLDGQKEWSFSGKDIFTGQCGIRESVVVVADFNAEEYVIDVKTGRGKVVRAG
ncbi:MAG: hypothetical protein GY722_04135 [bacterium]|nr:hypothetical protein [bacterium]